MKTQEVLVGKSDQLNVLMISDNTIDEVVVQGAYGTAQKRSDLVGSVFQVSAKQLETLPATRIDNLLGGLVPGLSIDPNTDSATGSVRTRYNTRVRGNASLSASNEPLWIVDGTPMYTGNSTNTMPGMSWTVSPLSFINPSDIESITVLKECLCYLYLWSKWCQRCYSCYNKIRSKRTTLCQCLFKVWYLKN